LLTFLGEVVVHSEDVLRPLGQDHVPSADTTLACLGLYQDAGFPTGTKKRIAELRLVAADVDWVHGQGPEVRGRGIDLLVAMTGRSGGLEGLTGDGVATLRTALAGAR
jgi:hypothetical protein